MIRRMVSRLIPCAVSLVFLCVPDELPPSALWKQERVRKGAIDLERLMLFLCGDAHVPNLSHLLHLSQVSRQPPDLLRFVKRDSYAWGGDALRP